MKIWVTRGTLQNDVKNEVKSCILGHFITDEIGRKGPKIE